MLVIQHSAAQQDTLTIEGVEILYPARDYTKLDSNYMALLRNRKTSEVLNHQPGIYIQETIGNNGSPQLYSINGSRSKDVAVLLNGIPINDASQISTFTDLNLFQQNNNSAIMIETGGHSVQHGANAVAGAIGLWNRALAEKPYVNVNMEAGKWNTFKQAWNAGGNSFNTKLHYGGSLMFQTSDGFSAAKDTLRATPAFDRDSADNYNLHLFTTYKGEKLEMPIRFYYNGQNFDIDQAAFTDGVDELRNSAKILQFSPRIDFNQVSINLNSQIQENTRSQASDVGEHSRFKAYSKYVDLNSNIYGLNRVNINPGITYTQAKTNQYGTDFFTGNYQRQIAEDTARYTTIEPYVMLNFYPKSGFSIDAGARYTDHSNFEGELNYEGAAAYRWLKNDNWLSRISIETASAYVTPSLFQLYSSFGNNELSPETSTSYQSTVTVNYKEKVKSKFTAFYRREKTPIVFSNATFRYTNGADESFAKGINFSTEVIPNEHIWGKAFVNLVDRKRYQELYRLPKVEFGAIANLQPKPTPNFSFLADYRWIGERTMPLYNNSTFMVDEFSVDGYHALNFTANYGFDSNQWNIYLAARNVPDQDIVENLGYNAEDFNLKVGVNYNFKP